MRRESRSTEEMIAIGEDFGRELLGLLGSQKSGPIVIELVGDVGAGKTTLTGGIAKGLGVETEVTSPSFTICKKYAFPGGVLSHYDFYRLPDPGIMREELDEAINEPGSVVIVEWGESVQELLPERHFVIKIRPQSNNSRVVEFLMSKN